MLRSVCHQFVALLLLVIMVFPVSASAELQLLPCDVEGSGDSELCGELTTEDPVTGGDGILSQITVLLATITAVISVIIIIIAGMTMVLSSGNSQKIQSSRDAIIYALVALVIAALARVIVVFVTSRVA